MSRALIPVVFKCSTTIMLRRGIVDIQRKSPGHQLCVPKIEFADNPEVRASIESAYAPLIGDLQQMVSREETPINFNIDVTST